MFQAGRYIYTVFMCHLAIEKALKALYANRVRKDPPRAHDLVYLVDKINLKLPEPYKIFIEDLNDLSVFTRYPDELQKILEEFKMEKTKEILLKTKELLRCLKASL